MRRLSLLLPALLLAVPPALAQGWLDVQACVEDEDEGGPLEGVGVRVQDFDGSGTTGTTGADGCVWLSVPVTTGDGEAPRGTTGLRAGPAYPSPAASTAHVPVTLGETRAVAWRLYDLLGRLVREGPAVTLPEGAHTLTIPLEGLTPGRYVYHVTGGSDAASGTVVKAGTGTEALGAARAAATTAMRLTFEAWRIGYDTLTAEREVEPEVPVILTLAKRHGPGPPMTDMALGQAYLGFEGGLYPGGRNVLPTRHAAAGVARGRAVVPRDAEGNPDPAGRYVFLSIGFSNTTEEFCGQGMTGGPPCEPWSFAGQAAGDPAVNHTALALADGARGGLPVAVWVGPASPEYDRIRDAVLGPKGLSEAQVQVVWLKVANPFPTVSLPAPDAEAYQLVEQYGRILRALKVRYPNLQQVFFSSRNWGGYATTTLHPEPFAYESGYAVKWTIAAQIAQMDGGGPDPRAGDLDYTGVAPWAAWGPYLWAEGLRPRADGLAWEPEDFEEDGTHPAQPAEQEVGARLLDFLKASPYTRCWFVAGGTCGG